MAHDPIGTAVDAAIARHRTRPGALLPLLHDVQHALGWIPDPAVAPIARALNLSRAEVHGVLTYYKHFRRTPPGRHVLQLCQAEACLSRGARALAMHAQQRLGCDWHATGADGAVTLEPVYCLGLCAQSPAALLDDAVHARLTPAALDALIAGARRADAAREGAAGSGTLPDQDARAAIAPSAGAPDRDTRGSIAARDGAPAEAPQGGSATAVVTVYVPRDAAALAAGADAVAAAIAAEARRRGVAVRLVRNGSRGLLWLEPLVEVATPTGRVGYGPLTPAEVPALFDAGCIAPDGPAHPTAHSRALGPVDALPYLQAQQRFTFARIGLVDPRSPADYAAHGGWAGLRRALALAPAALVEEIVASGLRGRGGAAFPTGIKWRTVLATPAAPKYVVCNADEGDSGSFADRLIMESDPFVLLEGMAIAALATGATQGFIYVRSEYPHAIAALEAAIAAAAADGFLGADVLGSGRAFHVEVRMGAGSYVCGEETALLESLEGRRGMVRAKPPVPAVAGLFGKPTVVNNVVTLAAVPAILAHGAAWYRDVGAGRSRGTLAVQLAGNVRRGGLVEVPFGVTLRQLVEDFGGGTASGRPIRAVQVGGPLGTYVPPQHWDVPLDYEAYAALGHVVGHGSVVVHDDTADLAALARHALQFCALESCGKCTPCRIGSVRGVELVDRIVAADAAGEDRAAHVALLRELCGTMVDGSLCAMGGMTPYAVLSALEHYPEDFAKDAVREAGGSHAGH